MKKAALVVALLAVIGCGKEAVQSSTAGRGVQVDLLFTKDGVSVYRFFDFGDPHYYAIPNNGTWAQTTADYYCGRGCRHREEIETLARR